MPSRPSTSWCVDMPACSHALCPCTDNPLANLSSERPDRRIFIGFGYAGFTSLACFQICHSEESQEEADRCAQLLAETCNPGVCPDNTYPPCDGVEPVIPDDAAERGLFFNTTQICERNGVVRTIPAGTVAGWSQADADARALSICGGDVPVTPPIAICPSIGDTFPSSPATVEVGMSVMLSADVQYGGAEPLVYLWLKNNLPLVITPGPALLLTNVQTSDSGQYDLQVSAPGCAPVRRPVLNLSVQEECSIPDEIDLFPFTLKVKDIDCYAADLTSVLDGCLAESQEWAHKWSGRVGLRDPFGSNFSTSSEYYATSYYVNDVFPPIPSRAASLNGKMLNYAEVWGPVTGAQYKQWFVDNSCSDLHLLDSIENDKKYWFFSLACYEHANGQPPCYIDTPLCGVLWLGVKSCGDSPDGIYTKVFGRGISSPATLELIWDACLQTGSPVPDEPPCPEITPAFIIEDWETKKVEMTSCPADFLIPPPGTPEWDGVINDYFDCEPGSYFLSNAYAIGTMAINGKTFYRAVVSGPQHFDGVNRWYLALECRYASGVSPRPVWEGLKESGDTPAGIYYRIGSECPESPDCPGQGEPTGAPQCLKLIPI